MVWNSIIAIIIIVTIFAHHTILFLYRLFARAIFLFVVRVWLLMMLYFRPIFFVFPFSVAFFVWNSLQQHIDTVFWWLCFFFFFFFTRFIQQLLPTQRFLSTKNAESFFFVFFFVELLVYINLYRALFIMLTVAMKLVYNGWNKGEIRRTYYGEKIECWQNWMALICYRILFELKNSAHAIA